MTLRQKQSRFAHMIALLILHSEQLGYEVTLGRGYASQAANKADNGHPRSNHLNRLALDLNLFKDGRWLTSGKHFEALHDYWDSIGGAERIRDDMNHFSLEHNGVR